MSAAHAQRDRPEPARPVLFWAQMVAVPLVAAALGAWVVTTRWEAIASAVSDLTAGAVAALAVGVALVVGGELRPILGSSRVDPSGVAWSTTFAFALLLFAGIVPAMCLLAGATALSGVVTRRATFRWLFNAGQYSLSLLAAWVVLTAFDRAASLAAMWSPDTLEDLVVVLLAAAAYFVTNELLVAGAVSALTGSTVVEDLRAVLTFEVAANGAQLALAPVVALVMDHAPALTALAVLPVAAIHRSAAAERESRHAASHDDLTDLANRKHFVSCSEQAIEECRRTGEPLAVLVVDLDRFKEVNDVLGHPAGDAVIVEAARRMREAVREGDVVGRLGGDEFAVLVPGVSSREEVEGVARRMRETLEVPFQVAGRIVDIGASIGIAMAPGHAQDFESLITRADTAMYAAKREGTGTCVYGPELDAGSAVHLGVLGAFRRAMDAGHITVEYQPKVLVQGRSLCGVEALVRWRDEDGSLLLPDYFVPVAEQSGLMPRLTAAVLDQTLAQCAAWSRQGLRVPVSVNVSLRDVLDPGFAVGVAARLVRFGVLAPMLTLEITERVVTQDLPRVRATLEELREIGVRLSLDDFGTGWSSLVLLRHLPVSEVKLDRSFVGPVASSPSDAAIVRSVTDLAHELGLTVVAEGVEDAGTWDTLAALGCDVVQGYLVARPMPPDAATAWVTSRPATAVGVRGAAT